MFHDFLQREFLNNPIQDYFICIAIFLIGILAIRVFRKILLIRLKEWTKQTATTVDDFLIHTAEKQLLPLFYFGVFYLGMQALTLNPALNKVINVLGLILLTVLGVRFLLRIIIYALEKYWATREIDTDKKQAFKGTITAIKLVVWGLAIIILLDNLGIKISALVAGLGIGGIAVALAAQAVLGDLFSYFVIFFDRPFEVGDFIIVDDYLGAVEHIGIKTTRIRSLSGEQIVFGNTDLTNSRVRNYKRMYKRRVTFKLGVTYDTTSQQLKEIPTIIANIINSADDTTFDRAHFATYGDFSLIFEVVYYVTSSDYNKYMDIQQGINLAIKEEFERRGIEFAYPTQTVYLNK